MREPPLVSVNCDYYRIISSRFPPIDLFERIAPPEDWESVAKIESLTNPRIRQEIGDISLIPIKRRVSGPGASYLTAPFVHISPERPSRFSDVKEYGLFYGSKEFETALYEVAYHRSLFHAATNDPPLKTEERVLRGTIKTELHDIRGAGWQKEHDPNDYAAGQALGRYLRDRDSHGILYKSVRKSGGENFAAFHPDVLGKPPIQTKHIGFHWNGKYIDRYFDFSEEEFIELPALI